MVYLQCKHIFFYRYGFVCLLILSAFVCSTTCVLAQNTQPNVKQVLVFEVTEGQKPKLIEEISASDFSSVSSKLNQFYKEAYKNGYFAAYVDTLTTNNQTLRIQKVWGKQFTWAKLTQGNIEPRVLRQLGIKPHQFKQKPINQKELDKLTDKLLNYAQNNGYPFATFFIDSLAIISESMVTGCLHLKPGPFIVFDTIIATGQLKLQPWYLNRHLHFERGQPFSQKIVDNAKNQLQNTVFVNQKDSVKIFFESGAAQMHLTLNKAKVNQFDFMAGLMPNEQTDGQVLFTGQVNLILHNLFKAGHYFKLDWQRIKPQNQQFDFDYRYPYFFKTPIGIDFSVKLLREDTLFFNQSVQVGFNYQNGAGQQLQAFVGAKGGRSLGLPGQPIAPNQNQAPPVADYNWTNYGLQWQINRLDNTLFPRQGYSANLETRLGQKTFQFVGHQPDTFTALPSNTTQWATKGSGHYFYSPGPHLTLVGIASGARVFNPHLFTNDLYRLGGLNSLRGFNQNFFFAQGYGLLTAEVRYYANNNSYLVAFTDNAYIFNQNNYSQQSMWASGLGAGIVLQTKAGLFSFMYALGRTPQQAFSINLSKIHFGVTSRF